MVGTQECVFRFGDVEVREREFRLIKAGEVIPVEPKAFRVLLFLLHNPQKLITKEELLNAVWGETAVSENSLSRSIALLRRLLGEDSHEPRFIETVSTVGYRFVYPVEASEDTHGGLEPPNTSHVSIANEAVPNDKGAASITTVAQTKHSKRRGVAAISSVGVIALLATAFWYLSRPPSPPHVSDIIQITHDGHHKYLAGTDGSRLYMGQWMPYIVSQVGIANGDIVPVPIGLPDPVVDDVSPDGSALLVRSVNTKELSLWSVEIPGGALRHLVPNGINGAWSPDGKFLIYSTANKDIVVARSDGSAPHTLLSAKVLGERFSGAFGWSPDGKTIRFTLGHKLWETDSDGSKLHDLLPGWHPSSWQCCGRWTPDGRFFLFLLQDPSVGWIPPVSQVWVLDERTGLLQRKPAEPIQLTSGPIRWDSPIPSKDGKKIFARGTIPHGELLRFDAQSHQLQPFMGGMSSEGVAFSSDGKSIAYVNYPDGILWKANRDGSNPMQLTDPPFYPINPRWSPDGTQILFFSRDVEGRRNKAFIIPPLGGTPQPLLPGDNGAQTDPNWSPDGRKVAFATGTWRDKNSDIRIFDLASHEVSVLPGSVGMFSPRWSPDGHFILASDALLTDLKVFNLKTQRWSQLQKGMVGWCTFSHDGQFIYFMRLTGDSSGVYRIRTSGGDAERVVELKGFHHAGANNEWMGLDPGDAPLLLRDAGSYEIYALTLETK